MKIKKLFPFIVATIILMPLYANAGMPLPLRDNNRPIEQQDESVSENKGVDVVSKYGKIISSSTVGIGGLTAWIVEKNGKKVLLYTTKNHEAIISGIVWDSASGDNLSDQYADILMPNKKQMIESQTKVLSALDGKYSGEIPESIKAVSSLIGVKEGKGAIEDTVYIMFDPRCPYCKKAYRSTRKYIKLGYSIKWIPVVVLGKPEQGNQLAAAVLQAKNKLDALDLMLNKKKAIKPTSPTPNTQKALDHNLAFFYSAFENSGVEKAGVPVAFFLDKRNGQARMMMGVSEEAILQEIFGR